jgi:hypothetical protein
MFHPRGTGIQYQYDCTDRGSPFWQINMKQVDLDWREYSKNIVAKGFVFIFKFYYTEMSFGDDRNKKKLLNRVNFFCLQMG